jgi:Do/DeqQ family serine protease
LQPHEQKPVIQNTLPLQQTSTKETYTALAASPDFVAASAISTPSVVYIKTSSTAYAQQDFFDFFFGGSGREQKVISSGSGVIFTSDGYIVTNNHVIENATSIEVIHNKRSYIAKLVGTDPSTDLAILKIEAKNLPNAKLGRSRDVQVGEWVLAVGNPFNLESTVTAGIVSAKGRNINILSSQFPIESFIQTDAAINPGNSGGALVNGRGELIGINTAILSRTGSYTGYGFAVPVDIVVKSVNDIIKYGEVQKAFMGAEVTDITPETFAQYKLEDYTGAVVTYVEKGGVAEKLGIRKGDVIVKINTDEINTKSGFDEQLSYYRPGDKIKVSYRQGGKVREGEIILTNREGTTEILKRETFSVEGLGADLETVSKVERDKLGIGNGVRVSNIRSGLMGRLGMEEGFIITAINKRPVTSAKEVVDVLASMRGRVIIEGVDKRGRGSYYQFMM